MGSIWLNRNGPDAEGPAARQRGRYLRLLGRRVRQERLRDRCHFGDAVEALDERERAASAHTPLLVCRHPPHWHSSPDFIGLAGGSPKAVDRHPAQFPTVARCRKSNDTLSRDPSKATRHARGGHLARPRATGTTMRDLWFPFCFTDTASAGLRPSRLDGRRERHANPYRKVKMIQPRPGDRGDVRCRRYSTRCS